MARILFGYWRSSAAYRVRIALGLKGLDYEQRPVDLRSDAQQAPDYLALNPQGLVPFLIDGDVRLSQSLAIIDHLDAAYPEPRLVPRNRVARAQVLEAALAIACDVHPLNNLRVLKYLKHDLAQDQDAIDTWARHWVTLGFDVLEKTAARSTGHYMFGDMPTLADICLVPQMYNARRIDTDLSAFPHLVRVDAALNELTAFRNAHPDMQPDAPEA